MPPLACSVVLGYATFTTPPGNELVVTAKAGTIVTVKSWEAVRGMGAMILMASNNFATARMFVPIIVLAAMGIGLNALLLQLERRLAPWRVSERER